MEYIKGKWTNKLFQIKKVIGKGGIGTVYKVKDENDKLYALKVSSNISSITKEFNLLKKLSDITFIPKVFNLDDVDGDKLYFFTMEYIDGVPLKKYMKKNISISNTIGIVYILLETIDEIYKRGFTYWDFKLENILIDKKIKKLRLVDFGGVVEKGKTIKEYTPTYNSYCWGLREFSEEDSIVFSLSMIFVSMIYGKEYNPLTNKIEDIIYNIKHCKIEKKLKGLIIRGLKGKYSSLEEYKKNLLSIIQSDNFNDKHIDTVWIDYFFIISILFFLIFILVVLMT